MESLTLEYKVGRAGVHYLVEKSTGKTVAIVMQSAFINYDAERVAKAIASLWNEWIETQ